ncbi:MAG: cytochrome c3 family protein [Planctomycetota bacterium]
MKTSIFQYLVTGLFFSLGAAVFGFQAQEIPAPDYSQDCTSSGCHDEYGKRDVIHDPVGSGDCDSCHEEVEGEEHAFELFATGEELCADCHDDVTEDLKFVHGPVAAGACTVCHDVHASDHEFILIEEPTSLCLKCHTALQNRMESQTYKHDPAVDDCMACHMAHGGADQMNLSMQLTDLCIDCHTDIEDVLDEATVNHGVMTTDKGCMNCHSPHASDTEHVLLKEPLDLCLSCHDEEIENGDDRIAGFGSLLADNSNHHGPIKDKNCTDCHSDVHGGTKFRLLSEEYPSEFYAPYDENLYALCFNCHDPDLVKDEKTEALTNFRNGDQNLHYLHVNREAKGRTCRACHDTHASSNPLHLTESVPFGDSGWEIPINFEKTENGGTCLPGCHREYSYNRVSQVVNIRR